MRRIGNERRRRPDIWVKFVKAAGIISWVIIFIILYIIDKAKPETETFFDRVFQNEVRSNWDQSLLKIAFYLSIGQFFFSIISLWINKKRHRRKSDRYSKSLIFMLVFSILIILFSINNI